MPAGHRTIRKTRFPRGAVTAMVRVSSLYRRGLSLMLDRPLTREGWTARAAALAIEGRAFIDGAYVPALDGATFAKLSPIDGKVFAHVADCGEADVDRAVKAARAAFESGVWRDADPQRKKTVLLRFAELIRDNARRARAARDARRRQGDRQRARRRRPLLRQLHPVLRRARRQALRRGRAARGARRRDGAQGAARRRRRDRAVELSADHRRLEDRAGAGRRQFGGPEAGRAVAARLARPRPARQRGRACPTASSTSCRVSARRPASRSRSTRTST